MSLKRTTLGLVAAFLAALLGLVATSAPASAASYARSVGVPEYKDGKIVAAANVSTNCEDTFGCYTYVKIERLADPLPGTPGWLRQWEYAGGHWANDGDNLVETQPISGCATYRTVVDSYNDAPGDAVLGISLGPVEFNLGNGVKRFHQSTASQTFRYCVMA